MAGPCTDGKLAMPDPLPTSDPLSYDAAHGLLMAFAAHDLGVDPSQLTNESGLESTEAWGGGVLWDVAKVFAPAPDEGHIYYVDLYSGEVLTSNQYDVCQRELVALGGPFDVPTPIPSYSPGPGLMGYAPGMPYLETPIHPQLSAGYASPFDAATLTAIYARVSPLISTFNGRPYERATSRIGCSEIDCTMGVAGWLPNAPAFDEWSFDVGRDGDRADPLKPDKPFDFASVPHDAYPELLAIVAADPVASQRASEFSWFDFASWYPKHPGLMSLTYSTPTGLTAGRPVANTGELYLTIKIDIVTRKVVDYGEINSPL